MADLESLPAFGPGGTVHVVVEATRGMRAKCKYEPDPGCFVFSRPLPHGLVYPFDWGFIPSTKGEDGDPVDALVLHDAACPVGCLIRCRPVAMLRLTQREKRKRSRNDRFVLRPAADPAKQDLFGPHFKRELEQFFAAAVLGTGKIVTCEGWRGPAAAMTAIRRAAC